MSYGPRQTNVLYQLNKHNSNTAPVLENPNLLHYDSGMSKEVKSAERKLRKAFREALNQGSLHQHLVDGSDKGLKEFTDKIAPAKEVWSIANEALRRADEAAGFPNASAAAEQIKQLTATLPLHLRKNAYYPLAGTDIFWAASFERLVMEDKNYDGYSDSSMWFAADDYKTANIELLLTKLRKTGLIPEATKLKLLEGDSDLKTVQNDLNRPNVTLVFKAGHPFSDFTERRFADEQMQFGAVIVANDITKPALLERLLRHHGYNLTANFKPPTSIETGWAIPPS